MKRIHSHVVGGFAFTVWSTGGGCFALGYERPDGEHVLITDAEFSDQLPLAGRDVLACAYGYYDGAIGGSEPVVEYRGPLAGVTENWVANALVKARTGGVS